MRTAHIYSLASFALLCATLTACTSPSQTEVAAWEALAVEALEVSANDASEVPKTQIYEPWADARYLPAPGEVRDMGTTIGQDIAQNGVNTAPSFQPARFAKEISRAAWDLALKGYNYAYPEAAPVAAVSPASVGQYGGSEQGLVLAGVPVATLQALEASAAADQRPRPDCLRILERSIINYCSIDTMVQACFGRTCQYFDLPAGQGVELRAGFDSLVGQRHPGHGGHPIRADRAAYATGSYFIPVAVPLSPNMSPNVSPISPAAPVPAAAQQAPVVVVPSTVTPAPTKPMTQAPNAPTQVQSAPTKITPEEAEAWDTQPLFAPAE